MAHLTVIDDLLNAFKYNRQHILIGNMSTNFQWKAKLQQILQNSSIYLSNNKRKRYTKNPQRMHQFVLICGTPMTISQNINCVNVSQITRHYKRSCHHLEIGYFAMKFINKKIKCCLYPIFLDMSSNGYGNIQTTSIYKYLDCVPSNNLLSTYKENISKEKELNIEFHITSHGSPDVIQYYTICKSCYLPDNQIKKS